MARGRDPARLAPPILPTSEQIGVAHLAEAVQYRQRDAW